MSTVPPEQMGGKARHLAELAAAGFPVPAGFVLARESEAEQAVLAVAGLGGYPVAVRSSGTFEDLADASFAGMYETILNVRSPDDLRAAIAACFASARAPRVREYMRSKGLQRSTEELVEGMRVLVQPMVASARAGVLFTIDPVLGREEEFYLEACAGLGERLVSGHVTPSRFRWNWQTRAVTLSEINGEGTRLSDGELLQLADLGLRIQSFYGCPQDIEWAIDGAGKIWILQSRPVTTVAWRQDVPELTNADLKDGGISARACPPMMFSMYQDAMQVSMSRYMMSVGLLDNAESVQWMFSYYGRAYWNAAAVKAALRKLPDYNEQQFDQGLGIQKDYGAAGPMRTRLTPVSLLRALNVLTGVTREYQDCLRMVDQFAPWFEETDRALRAQVAQVRALSEVDYWELVRTVYDFHFRTETSYFRTIYNNTNFQSDFRAKVAKLDPEGQVDVLRLLSGLVGVAHLEVQADLEKLSAVADVHGLDGVDWRRARAGFLEKHYHHGDAELDLRVPRWGEAPERVDAMVRDLLASPRSKRVGTSDWRGEWEALERRCGRQQSLRMMLARAREYLVKREQMRTYSTRAYYLWRRLLLEAARRFGWSEGEIHLWRAQEFLRQVNVPKEVLDQRRRLLQGYAQFEAPNEFGGSMKVVPVTGQGLLGIGCSSGEVEGVVRVVAVVGEAHQLLAGEILVTKFTDPGWTPAMARASAVITEVGGVLSHAAVIGREYGIPAVLNVAGATQKLRSGDRVRVNGRTGVITRLP